MWFEFLLEGLNKFAGEIIYIVLFVLALKMFPGLKDLFTKYEKLKKNDDTEIQQVLGMLKFSVRKTQRTITT